jgi:hypothetical protein
MFKNLFSEHFVFYELMWKNVIELDTTQMIIKYDTFVCMLVR